MDTDFFVVDESNNEVLFFASEESLKNFMRFGEGQPVFVRSVTPDDLNIVR